MKLATKLLTKLSTKLSMKRTVSRLALLSLYIFTVMASMPVAAATKKKRVPPDVALEQKPDLNVTIPQSQLDVAGYAVPPEAVVIRHFELAASNWSPKNFNLSASDVPGAGNFQTTGAQFTANYWSKSWAYRQAVIAPKIGVSFAQLARVTNLDVLGHQDQSRQTLNLYSLRLGAEVTPTADLGGHWQPFGSLSLLPYWQQIAQSDYGRGADRTGLAIEESAGVAWRSAELGEWLGARNVGLELGMLATQSSQLSGYGFLAGTRVEL